MPAKSNTDPAQALFATVTELASLRNMNAAPLNNSVALLLGTTAIADGASDPFYWNSASVTADDGINVIKMLGITTGRWIRCGSRAGSTPNAPTSIANIASVRALTSAFIGNVLDVFGYYTAAIANAPDGGGGLLYLDSLDAVTADNGVTVFVDTANRRWKRQFYGPINSLWAGAKFDGVTNDAAAIQAAIDNAGLMGVSNPAGTSNLGATSLTFPSGFQFFGTDKRSTIFLYTGALGALVSKTPTTARIFGLNFHDFTIQGPAKTAGSSGFDFTGIDASDIQRVRCIGFDNGIYYGGYLAGAGGYRNHASENEIVGNNTGVVVLNGANEIWLEANEISNNTNYGLDVQSGNSVTSMHCDYESNGTHVRTADISTRVFFGRMEGAVNFRYMTTATAQSFKIYGVQNSSGTLVQDLGKFTTDENFGRNAIRGHNLAKNGGFESWSLGTAVAPDAWTLSSATVAQENGAGNIQEGQFSALLTATAAGGVMFQDYTLPIFQQDTRLAFVLVARVKLGTSAQAAISLGATDGAGGAQQSQINMLLASGKSLITTAGWQTVFAICFPTSASPTIKLRIALQPDTLNGVGTAYFDAVSVMYLNGPTDEFYNGIGELFPTLKNTFSRTVALDFPNTLPTTSSDLVVAVPGAAVGDPVTLGQPAAPPANSTYNAFVSSAGNVTVRFVNCGAAAIDPASATFRITVLHY